MLYITKRAAENLSRVCLLFCRLSDRLQQNVVYSLNMINIDIVAALPDVRYRQRVQKRLTRLRKRLLAYVIKANPECFDHGGRLHPVAFPHAYLPRLQICMG